MAFEPHRLSALDVQDDAIPVVVGGGDPFRTCLPSQLEEATSVELIEPGQIPAYPIRMNPATGNMRHILCLTRQDRRTRELAEVSPGSYLKDVLQPTFGQPIGYVKRRPAEAYRHYQTAREQQASAYRSAVEMDTFPAA
jgi:hypothetical protein